MIEAEEDEFESHFVENPFIKLREKAATKTLHGKTHLGAGGIDVNEDEQDIIMIKESGKFVIKDLEDEEEKKKKAKILKRLREETMGTKHLDMNESDSDDEADLK